MISMKRLIILLFLLSSLTAFSQELIPAAGAWGICSGTNQINDSPIIGMALDSSSDDAILVIRLKDYALKAYVIYKHALPKNEQKKVTASIDGSLNTDWWIISDDGSSLFNSDPEPFITQLLNSHSLVITTLSSKQTFILEGIQETYRLLDTAYDSSFSGGR